MPPAKPHTAETVFFYKPYQARSGVTRRCLRREQNDWQLPPVALPRDSSPGSWRVHSGAEDPYTLSWPGARRARAREPGGGARRGRGGGSGPRHPLVPLGPQAGIPPAVRWPLAGDVLLTCACDQEDVQPWTAWKVAALLPGRWCRAGHGAGAPSVLRSPGGRGARAKGSPTRKSPGAEGSGPR